MVFDPPLIDTCNTLNNCQNGARIQVKGELVIGGTTVPIPAELGSFNPNPPSDMLFTISSIDNIYVGIHTVRVTYTFTDFLSEEDPMYTEFRLRVNANPN